MYIHVYTELAPKWGEASNDFAAIGTPECQEQLASKQAIEWENTAAIETMLLLTSVMYRLCQPLGAPPRWMRSLMTTVTTSAVN